MSMLPMAELKDLRWVAFSPRWAYPRTTREYKRFERLVFAGYVGLREAGLRAR